MTKKTETAAVATETIAAVAAPTKRGKPVDPNSKQSRARALFQTMNASGAKRGEIIKAMQSEIGLTANGAATYLQNFKKEAGLVKAKEPAAA